VVLKVKKIYKKQIQVSLVPFIFITCLKQAEVKQVKVLSKVNSNIS
jgi:hypothetical protein